jgi:hypothetical protein
MPCPHAVTEDHELPAVEAVLAGTLALMTGYCQSLQADLPPQNRVPMGHKIGENLALLADHPALTETFQRVLLGLRARWLAMSDCTEGARPAGVTLAWSAPPRLQ